jgi:hypothetical protein
MRKSSCPLCGTEQYPIVDIQSISNALEHDPNAAPLITDGRMTGSDWSKALHQNEGSGQKSGPGLTFGKGMGEEESINCGDGWDGIKCFDNGPETLSKFEAAKLLRLMCHARYVNK